MKTKIFFLTAVAILGLTTANMAQNVPSYVPTDGLVGWWPFNGNANDESGNGNDGVVNGATLTEDKEGASDAAISIADYGSNVEVPIPDSIFKNDFSISIWAKVDSIKSQYPTIVNSINNSVIVQYTNLSQGLVVNSYLQYPRGNTFANVNQPIQIENWNHIIIVNSNFQNNLYINGEFKGVSTNGNENQRSIIQNILRLGNGIELPQTAFYGKIDDIGIWNRALTLEEIKTLYYGSSPYTCNVDSLLNPAINYGSVTDIDGNVYPTVTINGREWLAQNLRTTRFSNGDLIPNITEENDWINMTSSAWCYYFNDSTYNCPFGKLYNWFAIRDQRNLCPEGWHVMTASDWEELVSGINSHKDWLNSSIGWGPNVRYKNESGMSIIPGGMRGNNAGGAGEIDKFLALNETAWFGRPNADPWRHAISLNNGGQFLTGANGYNYNNFFTEVSGTSVRCVQNIKNECDLIENISPGTSYASVGETKLLTALLNDTLSMLQWQYSTPNHDWINATNAGKFGTPTSSNLTLKNINLGDNLLSLRLIAKNNSCFDTSNVAIILVQDTCFLTITDTIITTITDTILTTVTDTLLIDVLVSTGPNPLSNLIRVYPNPTSTHLIIDAGQYTLMTGYTLTVTSAAGALVWTQTVSEPIYTLDLSTWGGTGLYFITLKDPQGNVVTTRKIVVQ